MDFNLDTVVPAPSEERISWFESAYRIALPDVYKEMLRVANGGVPKKQSFLFNGTDRMIERFLPLFDDPKNQGDEGWMDITVVLTQLDLRLIDDEDLVGMNVIPFASLFGGDFLCLDFRENSTRPSVAVWNHEISDELEPDLTKISSSYQEFIKLLS